MKPVNAPPHLATRRRFIAALSVVAAVPLAWRARGAFAATPSFDFTPQQSGRVRAPKDQQAASALGGLRLVAPGAFTVAIAPFGAPIASYATDAHTVVGSDADYAQLVADALGLTLQLVPVAWADWPLGLSSGKYDAVISNVGVTEQRKRKFDFTTYRLGLHAFYVANESAIRSIREPRDIAGLRIATDSGTIQERILLEWNQQNEAKRLKGAELAYYDDFASTRLALLSKRVDAVFNPDAPLLYAAATQGGIRLVGTINAGWPYKADAAIATRKDSGLASVLTAATNGLIRGGQYRASLARWGLEAEAVARSETNPPGLRDA